MNNFPNFFTDGTRRLSHIRRYSSYPVIRQENVSEHSFWVTYYSYIIGLYLKDYFPINFELLLEKALLHDIEESQTGDVVRPLKYHDKEFLDNVKRVEISLLKRHLDSVFNIDIARKLYNVWFNSKDDSVEGEIVKLSDFLCVFVYCADEIKSGNSHMRIVLDEALHSYEKFLSNKIVGGIACKIRDDILSELRVKK